MSARVITGVEPHKRSAAHLATRLLAAGEQVVDVVGPRMAGLRPLVNEEHLALLRDPARPPPFTRVDSHASRLGGERFRLWAMTAGAASPRYVTFKPGEIRRPRRS